MAEIVKTVIRDGKTIDIYDTGSERDRERGRLVKPPDKTLITSEKGAAMNKARREKATLRRKIGGIRSAGIEIASDADEDEVFNKGLLALEKAGEKEGTLYFGASSARSMEGIHKAFISSLLNDGEIDSIPAAEWQRKADAEKEAYLLALPLLVKELRAALKPEEQPEVIEGKTL